MLMTTEEAIRKRWTVGTEHCSKWADRAMRNVNRYLGRPDDALGSADEDLEHEVVLGEVNPVAIGIRQGTAATCINTPDFIVKAGTPEAAEAVRQDLRREFERLDGVRIGRRCDVMRRVCGLAWVAYLWEDGAFEIEYVKPRDLMLDPHTSDDRLMRPRWAGRRIYLPAIDAIERYGAERLGVEPKDMDGWETTHKDGVEVWLYWDAETEAEIVPKFGTLAGDVHIETRENPYKRVPMIALRGDPDPMSEWPLSNYDTSGGPLELHKKLQGVLNAQAENGGGYWWVLGLHVSEEQRESMKDGTLQGPLVFDGVPGDKAMGYTPNQALHPQVLQALAMLDSGIQKDQAVSGLDLGQSTGAKTATENTLIASRSTARGSQWRKEYELFQEMIAWSIVECKRRFGMDKRASSPESDALWQAYKSVVEVRAVEESTAFKDPNATRQQASQLFATALMAVQPCLALGKPIDVAKLFSDVLRANDKSQPEAYFLPPDQAQELMQQMQAEQAAANKQGTTGQPKTPAEMFRLTYQDAPPDVRRQIEVAAGLQPSSAPEVPEQQHELQMEHLKLEDDLEGVRADLMGQAAQHEHDAQMAAAQHERAMQQQRVTAQLQEAAQVGQQLHETQLEGARQGLAREQSAMQAEAARAKVSSTPNRGS